MELKADNIFHHLEQRMEPKPVIEDTPVEVPDWLTADTPETPLTPQRRTLTPEEKQLMEMQFSHIFERVCDQLALGQPLTHILNSDPRSLDNARFLRWVLNDEDRKAEYYKALEEAAEHIFVNDMIRIADAEDSLEDVQRSTLKLNTRWKYMAICNRKRFGDIKQIDSNIHIDLVDAIRKADERVRTIEVNPIER